MYDEKNYALLRAYTLPARSKHLDPVQELAHAAYDSFRGLLHLLRRMGKRVGMIDALQERQIIEGISYSVHLLNGKSLADDLDAASLGTPFGNHIYMGHILKCRIHGHP